MVAELVETSRLWGRVAARIDPRCRRAARRSTSSSRTYDEPRWNRKRASVVATERVTLYGLPIVAGRTVAYGGIDPELSRSLFIRSALVEGDWEARHRFLAANRELLERGRRARGPRAAARHPRHRPGACTTSTTRGSRPTSSPARTSTAGGATRAARDPDRLTFREADVAGEAAAALDRRAVPEAWRQGDLTLPLSYVFDPGAAARRRDRPRPAHRAAAAQAARLRLARPRAARGARHRADPLAAEGVPALARPRARGRRGRARAGHAALRAAARRARARAGGAPRRPDPALRLGSRPAPAAPADDLPRRGRPRRARRRGRRPRRAARAGPPAPARAAERRRVAARAPRDDPLGGRRPAEGGRAAGHRRRRSAATPRSSTRARRSACACSRRRPPSARRCTPARASCSRSTCPRRSATSRAA